MVGVGHETGGRSGAPTQADEDLPMSRAWAEQVTRGPTSQLIDEREGLGQGRGTNEDFRIRHDTHETLQHQLGECERFVAAGQS